MTKYLLKFIRETQADRPSEAFLALDNFVAPGVPAYMTQEAGKDTYIIVESDKDISIRLQEIAQMENRMGELARAVQDGTLVLAYPRQGEVRADFEEVHVRVIGGETTSYDSVEDAQAFADALNSDEGYELIDIIEGKASVIFGGRPSEKLDEEGNHYSPVVANITNLWNREQ